MYFAALTAFIVVVPLGAIILLLFYGRRRKHKDNPLRDNDKDFPLGITDGEFGTDAGVAGLYD